MFVCVCVSGEEVIKWCIDLCKFVYVTTNSWLKLGHIIKLPATIDSALYCNSGINEDEFHFLFHCPKNSIPREKFYNQIQQNFADFNQLSYTELIIKLMNSQNFSVNSHLLKFVSLCNDLRTNLFSNHADDTWLTVVTLHCIIIAINCNFMLKLLRYCKNIIVVMQIKLMLLLLLLSNMQWIWKNKNKKKSLRSIYDWVTTQFSIVDVASV